MSPPVPTYPEGRKREVPADALSHRTFSSTSLSLSLSLDTSTAEHTHTHESGTPPPDNATAQDAHNGSIGGDHDSIDSDGGTGGEGGDHDSGGGADLQGEEEEGGHAGGEENTLAEKGDATAVGKGDPQQEEQVQEKEEEEEEGEEEEDNGEHRRPWKIDIQQLLELRQPKADLRRAKKKVRKFYKRQNNTIDDFERMHIFAHHADKVNSKQRRKMERRRQRQQVQHDYERVRPFDDDDESLRARSRGISGSSSDGAGPEETDNIELEDLHDVPSSSTDGEEADEKALLKHLGEVEDEQAEFLGKLAIRLSFWCNVLLFVLKVIAAIITGSLSIISSALDSSLDLLSGLILFLTHFYRNRQTKKDIYTWPLGKSRFEPLGFITFATVMCTASLMIVLDGVLQIITGVWTLYISPPSAEFQQCQAAEEAKSGTLWPQIAFYVGLGVMGFTIVVKSLLFIFCTLVHRGNPSVKAYAMDHRNDVLSNAVLVVAIILAYFVSFLWWTDPAGAICLSLFIVQSWMRATWEQMVKLVGKSAPPDFLQKLTYLAYNHDPRIQHIDTVYAFYIGQNLFVEVDVVMDEKTILKVYAHDIGEALQKKIEKFPNVERCYIHLDYEFDHSKDEEHKRIV